MADASAAMAVDEVQIDEALYSRQLYVLGHEAMRRMAGATVLIVGLKGLGVEIAKNVVLAGVKSVTLHDDAPVALSDLSAQFFLTEADVGKPRAEVTAPRLAELNQYTPVARSTEALTPALCASFGIVVLTGVPLAEAVAINEACRGAGARFIMTDTFGVFGAVFCDFGDAFTVYDTNGEEPLSAMVSSISQEEEGLVTVLDEGRHGLEDGDFVTFTEVKGMAELNGCEPKQVKVKGPYTFTIDDTRGCCKYECGGYMHQVKQHKTLSFKSLAASLAAPEFLLSDFAKFDRPMQLHLGFQALHAYRAEHGSLPAPSDAAAAAELLARAKAIGQAAGGEAAECEFSDRLLRNLASGSRGELSPMCAFFGGIVGQEVMKAASGKFTPVQQWMYFDAEESLPGGGADGLPAADTAARGNRHDAQACVLGWPTQEALGKLSYLLVGAGAIGCEMLKNWAMMGVGSAGGAITVTDPDTIEKSNLNRQFLFRPWDVSKAKAECAAKAIQTMNPACPVAARLDRVGPETENVFDDAFWEGLSGVCNALDNVQARLYVDQRCIYYQRPLLESGTLGAKGNVQVVVPRLTESYGSSRDPPERSIPVCTLKNFPNEIAHTIQWSRDLFEGAFRQSAEDVNAYLSQPDFLASLERQPGVRHTTLNDIKTNLVEKPIALEACVVWARLKFEELFHNQARALGHRRPHIGSHTASHTSLSPRVRPRFPHTTDRSAHPHVPARHGHRVGRAVLVGAEAAAHAPPLRRERSAPPRLRRRRRQPARRQLRPQGVVGPRLLPAHRRERDGARVHAEGGAEGADRPEGRGAEEAGRGAARGDAPPRSRLPPPYPPPFTSSTSPPHPLRTSTRSATASSSSCPRPPRWRGTG